MSEIIAAPATGATTTNGAAPTGGVAAVSAAATPTPTPTPTPTVAGDWTTGLPDESRGYIQNKGWKNPSELLDSYRGVEKLVGVPQEQLVRLPKDETDTAEWGKVWGKLGRPENAEGYGLKGTDGNAGEFHKWASTAFHEANLTAKQAQAVVAKWDGYVTEQTKAQETAFNQKVEQEVSGLKAEWGAAHEQNLKQAQSAARGLGVADEVVDALEKQVGYSATMKLFQKIGAKMGEGDFVTGDRSNSFGTAMTPEAAKSRITELKQDQDFANKFRAGGQKELAEMERLHKFAYGEMNS